jgi:outer membrane protein
MNRIVKIVKSRIMFSCLILLTANIAGQDYKNPVLVTSGDSLSLNYIIEEVIRNHPTVLSAEEALKNADTQIELAKTGYYPQINLTGNYTNIGPVIHLTIPDFGTFKLYPNNNYSAALNLNQVVYDFGRTRQNVEFEKESKNIGEQALEQVRQKMSLAAVSNFYTIAFLQEAIKINDENLATLNSHLKYVETMKETGAATDYQILSTKVKISGAESLKVDLLTALDIQQAYMSALLGRDVKTAVKEELNVLAPVRESDSLLSFAFHNRNEIIINHLRASQAEIRYQLIKTLNNPTIDFYATGGFKNGYIPNLEEVKANYVVGLGISVPIFDALRTKYHLVQARTNINTINFEAETTKRNISSEVREAEDYMTSALQKVSQFSLQLQEALQAYSLAETSFRAGVITNLELLDSNTSVSQSRLLLLKAKIDYAASIYRFKAALGEKLY